MCITKKELEQKIEELRKYKAMAEEISQIQKSLEQEVITYMNENDLTEEFTDSAKITYVGNTRVFVVVNGKYLKQLTRDDTTLEYLLATGQLDSFTAESFERKNEITACFGADNPALLKLKQIDASGLDALILTSDGIHDYVSLDEMEDIYCTENDRVKFCKKLIEQARKNGSMDDMSISVCYVGLN